ncbi:head-tail connector protein [Roseicitreum antarcticum]|uniref:Phage gp6-like head-tail connector protein n=1 Tax=Roseicitreum antarcticum TaxID=564137 RepID=A0A1H2WC85_9RHOB|nr:head-tail connector protein [Roseicitreum antarcticum]SDW78151.1 hypothetical protein SAMN04488238_103334 [Roseicitreum antarcticum]
MTPYLVVPPATMPVDLAALKAHLRVDGYTDNAQIEALQAGAVAMLDGWGGALGRCILPQTWAIDVTGPGPHLLPFPDASDVAVTAEGGALSSVQRNGALGVSVEVQDASAGQDITITAQYALPDARRPAAEVLIKLIVGNWYENRESVVVGMSVNELPMAANALISALRWFRV